MSCRIGVMERMACLAPTARYPDGRTGTPAGHRAHQRAGERACEPCRQSTLRYLTQYGIDKREKIAAKNRTRRDRRQEVLDKLKDVPCADCGGRFPPICMDFDHVQGKSFTISRASTRSLTSVLREVERCEVVCANCHRIRTAQRLVRKHPKEYQADLRPRRLVEA